MTPKNAHPNAANTSKALRDALISAALGAVYAESEWTWARRYESGRRYAAARYARDDAIVEVERVLDRARELTLLSERSSRALVGHVFDAMACEERAVRGRLTKQDPEGHYQRVDQLTGRLCRSWEWAELKRRVVGCRRRRS